MAFSSSGTGTGSGANGTYFRVKYGQFEKGSKKKQNIQILGNQFEGRLMGVSREEAKPQFNVPAQWILHLEDIEDQSMWLLTLPVGRKSTYKFLNDLAGMSDQQLLGPIKLKCYETEKEGSDGKIYKKQGIAIRLGEWDDYENRPTCKFPYLGRDEMPKAGVVYFDGGSPVMIPSGRKNSDGTPQMIVFKKDDKVQMQYDSAEMFCRNRIMKHIHGVLKAGGRLDEAKKEIAGDDYLAENGQHSRNENLPTPPPPPPPPAKEEPANNNDEDLDDLPF